MYVTYIPMARGFVYLAASLDGFSRRALVRQMAITREADVHIDGGVQVYFRDPQAQGGGHQ